MKCDAIYFNSFALIVAGRWGVDERMQVKQKLHHKKR